MESGVRRRVHPPRAHTGPHTRCRKRAIGSATEPADPPIIRPSALCPQPSSNPSELPPTRSFPLDCTYVYMCLCAYAQLRICAIALLRICAFVHKRISCWRAGVRGGSVPGCAWWMGFEFAWRWNLRGGCGTDVWQGRAQMRMVAQGLKKEDANGEDQIGS